MKGCKAQYKRERVRVNGSNANTQICFEVRAHSSTSPPSYRRISNPLVHTGLLHREPPLRIWGNITREYTTPLSTEYNLSQRLVTKATQTPPHTRGVGT